MTRQSAPAPSFPAFIAENRRWLGAGALLTFSSLYGQTVFISIFAGEIRAEFDLSHGAWGGIYTIGTLMSAALMIWLGALTDRFRARVLGPVFLVLIAIMCLSLATVRTVWLLPLVIFGLRLCGQGMLSHIAVVGVGRWFARGRGKANAVVSSGFVFGEAVLPFVFVALSLWLGWRSAWVIAAVMALAAIPLLRALLAQERTPRSEAGTSQQTGLGDRHWTRRDALRFWLFWIAALAVASPSTFGTAYLFQQVHLTDIKGWDLAGFVALLPLYSAVALSTTFLFGAWADRFGTAMIFPAAMLPAAAGFALAGAGTTLWAAAVTFVLLGFMQGGMAAISGAFWPEYFGTRHLGAIRAMATAAMVLGSAIGPGITGYLLDIGVGFERQLLIIGAYFAILSLVLAASFARVRQMRN